MKTIRPKGFALVATLSLLMLLALIAVGILTLSAVTVRSSSGGEARLIARSNARLALILAIGELQKEMGPDMRVSATSEILATSSVSIAKPNTTGVWGSWDFDPSSGSLDYSAEKESRFRRWLVSTLDPASAQNRNFANQAWTGKTIELVGDGSLGGNADAKDKALAGLVPILQNGKEEGAYAWHVSDESVKARVNLYRDPDQNQTLAQKRALLGGHRPDPSVMKGADETIVDYLPSDLTSTEFTEAKASIGKITSVGQLELLDKARGKVKQFRNDLTPYSLGVMTDVRHGGLKQDLSSVFEMSDASGTGLPGEFNGKKLYASTHGITGFSDPYWSALASYYNSFRSLSTPETSPTFAVKPDTTFTDPVPAEYNPAPVIAKVDTIFSLVGRPLNEIWWAYGGGKPGSAGEKYDYFVDLIFTPVVTLHNPYNVNISFQRMQVTFTNVPVAFNFMFQSGSGGGFVSESTVSDDFESINTMYYGGHTDATGKKSRNNKSFVMNIADWKTSDTLATNSTIKRPITMKPGQTLICGPTFPASSSFKNDTSGGTNTDAFDWRNTLTSSIKAKPTFTPGLGFEIYAVTPGHIRRPGGFMPAGWSGHPFLLLRDQSANPKLSKSTITDKFYVEYKVQRPSWYINDSGFSKDEADPIFEVTAKLQSTADDDSLIDYAKLQFDYQDDTTIKEIFNDRVYRYPPTASLTGSDVAAPSKILYGQQGAYVHPFAIFSAYSRTTNGGVYETGKRTKIALDSPQVNLLKDGRLAGKPFLFHNPSRSNFTMNLANEKPGVQPYELNFQPFLSKGDFQDYMDVDATNRVPSLTGNKTTSGIKSGSYLEIPSGPLQTLADFRRSNALTTSYLPHFVQPVGNSLLHPLMSANKAIETNSSITSTALLDHSVLANHALYDRFYFSTFATHGTTKPDAVFEQFMKGSAPLASQAFQPYLPAGKTVANAKDDLFASGKPKDTAYKTAAEYQMVRGPFNVNSTSVQAWKAVLASMNKSEVSILWARTAELETKQADGVPITAMSLPNGGPIGDAINPAQIDNEKTNDWNGYRELTEPELENLAIKIVAEVRERGPFLSMSEFVNRQIGPVGPLTLSGALEAAIAKAEINEKQDAAFPDTFLDQVPITTEDVSDPKLYNYKTPQASTGNPAAGAPGWISQGDLLRILGPSATVRSDTFVIRTYGEAKDSAGKVTARAYAEAVVQRIPEYLNPVDRASVNAAPDGRAAPENKKFGRRMKMVSFRWLANNEI